MNVDTVGSYLQSEEVLQARQAHTAGAIDIETLRSTEDKAMRALVEKQIACGLRRVTSGEIHRRYWDKDFYFGLKGVECANYECGHLYQDAETFADLVNIKGPVTYNPEHPFFKSFARLHSVIGGRAIARQTIPSPTEFYLQALKMSTEDSANTYLASTQLAADIAAAWHATIERFYALGCRSIVLDDTAFARLSDYAEANVLLLGGFDVKAVGETLINIFNTAVAGLPADLETCIYISRGDSVIPRWTEAFKADAPLAEALKRLDASKFFLPFDPSDLQSLDILSLVPSGKEVVLGLVQAHSPYDDRDARILKAVERARELTKACISLGTQSGFKFSSFITSGLTEQSQWDKIEELKALAATL